MSHLSQDDEHSPHIGNLSLIEVGEKLYHWRYYTAVPALMFLLLTAHATARTATIGTIIILLGTLARLYTTAFIGQDSHDQVGPDHIVSVGPYSLIRHPLYTANMIITFGVVLYAGVIWLGFPLLCFFAFQYFAIAKYEENSMLAKFGDEFQRYMDRVPAWVPGKSLSADDFPVPGNISGAFSAEKKTLAVVGSILFLLMLVSN